MPGLVQEAQAFDLAGRQLHKPDHQAAACGGLGFWLFPGALGDVCSRLGWQLTFGCHIACDIL